MRNLMLAIAGLLSACAHTPVASSNPPLEKSPARAYFADLDVYGTTRLTAQELNDFLGKDFRDCIQLNISNEISSFAKCHGTLIARIQERYHFAYAEFNIVEYFKPDQRPFYATLDVVEPEDVSSRMKWMPRPTQHFDDPDGLIQAWDDYMKVGFELLRSGEMLNLVTTCPVFHCTFGHQHPKLAPYEKTFTEGVKKNKDKLRRIILEDRDDHSRTNSIFLLAYDQDGKDLIHVLSERFQDENKDVRNAVMRVFWGVARSHPELDLPVDKVIEALNFPTTLDRNKATLIILELVSNDAHPSKYKKSVMEKAVPVLLKLLRLQQPNNHDHAYLILKALSGQNYGERDYLAWERWYQSR